MSSILLKVYITPFAEKGVEEAEKWSCDAAKEALNVVNAIWLKANIAFVINDCVIDKPLDMAKSARNNDQRLLDVLSLRHKPDNLVHIYLVNPIENLSAGGSSYVDSDPEPASFIQWYGNVVANGRAWAHELGHLMSLDHVEIDYADERQAALPEFADLLTAFSLGGLFGLNSELFAYEGVPPVRNLAALEI